MSRPISHLLTALIFGCIAAISTYAQTPPAECPTITVTGPAGIPDPGALIPFSAQVTGKVPSGLPYTWSVSTGKVAKGQGTSEVKIDAPEWTNGVSVTATVEVLGLPKECPNTATETMAVAIDAGPIYVGSSSEARAYRGRVNELLVELDKYPNSQGYIFIGTESPERYNKIDQLVRATASQSGFDQRRLTIDRETTPKELIELWVIRPGVDNPLCKACDEPNPCPEVELIGPAEDVGANPFKFTAVVNGVLGRAIRYEWKVSKGQIIDGQGTPEITVVDSDGADSLTATVDLLGLPEGCIQTASETTPPHETVPPILIDELELSIAKVSDQTLRAAAEEQRSNPNHNLYVVAYFTKDVSQFDVRRAVKKVADFFIKEMKLTTGQFEIETVRSEANSVKIYRLPPGAERPTP